MISESKAVAIAALVFVCGCAPSPALDAGGAHAPSATSLQNDTPVKPPPGDDVPVKPPPGFVEVTPPGPPPYAWGPYWVCSLSGDRPICSHWAQRHPSRDWFVEPWTPALPPLDRPIRSLLGTSQGTPPDVLDADGVWWFKASHDSAWSSAPETRHTTSLVGGPPICGAKLNGFWCSYSSPRSTSDILTISLGRPSEIVVNRSTAGFVLADGRVGLIDANSWPGPSLAESLAWIPALKDVRSLAIVHGPLACGLSREGRIVCATRTEPSRVRALGDEVVGGRTFSDGHAEVSIAGVVFTDLRAAGVGLFARATDGRVFTIRPPDDQGGVISAEAEALVGEWTVCIVRRRGPWWCIP